ncbi:transmembrane protease serine 9-like isoform X2 [Paramacrobiotus metropolitanus]|nr:transmembrane protease serine 9-like isoform X2 [Paramacrobiotus metropolitanus]
MSLQQPEMNGTCLKDYVAVWDLKYEYYQLKVACGRADLDLVSYSDSLIILFVSDDRYAFNGFILKIERSRQYCGADELRCEPKRDAQLPKGNFKLIYNYKCLRPERICDGQKDCPNGEDEICTTQCGKKYSAPDVQTQSQTRIVGGIEAFPNAWPWQVNMKMESGKDIYTCGGSVIAAGWILTAGHCCQLNGVDFAPSQLQMKVGFHRCHDPADGLTIHAERLFVPADYSARGWGVNYDFCIIKLVKMISFTNKIQPVCLPRPYSGPLRNQNCTATGCGNMVQWSGSGTQPAARVPVSLMAVNLAIMNNSQCARYFPRIAPEMVCGASKLARDTCRGDSGGPFCCKVPDSADPPQYQLSGITSFGHGCASGRPGVFSNPVRALPFLIRVLYEHNFWGWHADTVVPLLNHRRYPRPPYTPKVVANLSERLQTIDWLVEDGDATFDRSGSGKFTTEVKLLKMVSAIYFSLTCYYLIFLPLVAPLNGGYFTGNV